MQGSGNVGNCNINSGGNGGTCDPSNVRSQYLPICLFIASSKCKAYIPGSHPKLLLKLISSMQNAGQIVLRFCHVYPSNNRCQPSGYLPEFSAALTAQLPVSTSPWHINQMLSKESKVADLVRCPSSSIPISINRAVMPGLLYSYTWEIHKMLSVYQIKLWNVLSSLDINSFSCPDAGCCCQLQWSHSSRSASKSMSLIPASRV